MKKVLYLVIALIVLVIVLLILGQKHVSTEITINAPVVKVWTALTDFKSYPDWNPFIRKLSGEIKKGNTIEVVFQVDGSEPVVFTPEVKVYEENSIFQWEGRLLIPGIFTGTHTFELVEIDAGKTKLMQKEDFSGILVPFFNFDSTTTGFSMMNEALRKRVENR